MSMTMSQIMVELDKRRGRIKIIYGIMVVCMMSAVVLAFVYAQLNEYSPESSFVNLLPLYAGALACVAVISFLFYNKEKKKFKTLFKENFVVEILKQNFENVTYTPDKGYDKKTVKQMGLFPVKAAFASEDLLEGSYKGVNFSQSDMDIITKANRYRYGQLTGGVTTGFGFRMLTFDYPNKEIAGVKIFSKNIPYRSNFSNGIKLRNVSIGDVQFDNNFDVLAVTEREAYNVLTLDMRDGIRDLCDKNGNIAMYITNGKLYLGMSTRRNAFDGGIFKNLSYSEEKAEIVKDIQLIKDIIDTLHIA